MIFRAGTLLNKKLNTEKNEGSYSRLYSHRVRFFIDPISSVVFCFFFFSIISSVVLTSRERERFRFKSHSFLIVKATSLTLHTCQTQRQFPLFLSVRRPSREAEQRWCSRQATLPPNSESVSLSVSVVPFTFSLFPDRRMCHFPKCIFPSFSYQHHNSDDFLGNLNPFGFVDIWIKSWIPSTWIFWIILLEFFFINNVFMLF